MSGAEFTPGPWRIAGNGTIRAGELSWIASVNWDNRKANARLIAAAPDLFAILATMVEICERSFAPSHAALGMGSAGWVEGRQLREAVDRANAALAAARGTL